MSVRHGYFVVNLHAWSNKESGSKKKGQRPQQRWRQDVCIKPTSMHGRLDFHFTASRCTSSCAAWIVVNIENAQRAGQLCRLELRNLIV
jgi:hypothetical protein